MRLTIPIDQAHKQENAFVKGAGGFIGLTENPTAFRQWMKSGPELARIQRQFEDEYFLKTIQLTLGIFGITSRVL